jgi:predicted DNA-binding transcriptional regulator YafY
MLDASARLLRLLSILQLRPDWSGADLAGRLGVTTRTLRRDVQRLRELGYPVHASPGVAGGYRLGAGSALPPLLLDDDEAVAVAIGLRTAASQTVTGFEETALRALTKLEQVLPARLRERTAAVALATVALPSLTPTVDPGVLTTIARACAGRRRLTFGYSDRAGARTARTVEPHRLVHAGYRWYLVARDIERDDWRTFRLDRLESPATTGGRFVPRDPPDAASFVAAAITTAPYRFQARVLVHAPAAVIAAQVPPTTGMLEAVDEASCLLTTGANDLDVIAVHLAMLGADFTVLDPPELTGHVQSLADRLHRSSTRSAVRADPPPPPHADPSPPHADPTAPSGRPASCPTPPSTVTAS